MGARELNKLNEEWPKACGCGRVYCGPESWKGMKLIGVQADDFATLELRNCPCGTTLAVLTEIHDITKE